MSVKQQILSILSEKPGEYVSGEEIAKRLGVSRAAVWKAVSSLEKEESGIESAHRKGYRLRLDRRALDAHVIRAFLPGEYRNVPLEVLQTVDSTNRRAKVLAVEGAVHGTTVIAEEQTAGRGRLGRQFSSPRGSGLYMSAILQKSLDPDAAVEVTTMAAVAVARAVEKLGGPHLSVKWVNDLFLDGKKIAGILTEAVADVETRHIERIVVGIGINVTTRPEEFPPEVRLVASSLFGEKDAPFTRSELAAAILSELLDGARKLGTHAHMPEYRQRCLTLGKRVEILKKEAGSPSGNAGAQNGASGREGNPGGTDLPDTQPKNPCGEAFAVEDDGTLLVRLDNGEIVPVSYGEVSVLPVR